MPFFAAPLSASIAGGTTAAAGGLAAASAAGAASGAALGSGAVGALATIGAGGSSAGGLPSMVSKPPNVGMGGLSQANLGRVNMAPPFKPMANLNMPYRSTADAATRSKGLFDMEKLKQIGGGAGEMGGGALEAGYAPMQTPTLGLHNLSPFQPFAFDRFGYGFRRGMMG